MPVKAQKFIIYRTKQRKTENQKPKSVSTTFRLSFVVAGCCFESMKCFSFVLAKANKSNGFDMTF